MTFRTALLTAALVLVPVAVEAQTAAAHVAMADRDRAAGNLAGSYQHNEAAIRVDPQSYEALWKASRDAVDLGESEADRNRRTALYKSAELYARRAVAVNPRDAEGHFSLARAIGRNALTMGSRDRVKYAGEVREHALDALKADPKHAGALHVMGVWNAEVMRLSGIQRFAAKNILGGKVFGEASWAEARRYMEAAVAAEPNRITHRLDLADVYADMGEKARAKEQYDAIARMPVTDPNDARYKKTAAEHAAKLR